jgi:hypothetical protein
VHRINENLSDYKDLAMKSRHSTLEKLCAIVHALEQQIALCKQNPRTRKKRVAATLYAIRKIVKNELGAFCNCQQITVVNNSELDAFEAKMAIPCPVHGASRLGILVTIGGYASDGDPRDQRLEELVKQYQRSCISQKRRSR